MDSQFYRRIFDRHKNSIRLPDSSRVHTWANTLLRVLFPEMGKTSFANEQEITDKINTLNTELCDLIAALDLDISIKSKEQTNAFFNKIPHILDTLLKDAEAIVAGDPAAKDQYEVIRTYPGFYAISLFRIAHEMEVLQIPLLPRIITEYAHSKTGIDIHPGADIAPYFCIDHGTGIVIGETTKIDSWVKIYQGVTLGALSVAKELASIKRHPTIQSHVVIYAGATILGGDTTIGAHSIIGGNVWLTRSLPPHSKVYHKPQLLVSEKEK